MNYQKIYDAIIRNRAVNAFDGYTENHHILPKSLGGPDDASNMVRLSAREHFICHLLLTKMYPSCSFKRGKMVRAFMMMLCSSDNQERFISSHRYSVLREQFAVIASKQQSGEGNTQFGTMWITDGKEDTKVIAGTTIPKGWQRGRAAGYRKSLAMQERKKSSAARKEKEREETKKKFRAWYAIYEHIGFTKFVEQTGYDKSHANLVQRFSSFVDEFVPQNGKQRSK